MTRLTLYGLFILLFAGCDYAERPGQTDGPRKVEVRHDDGRAQLFVDGQPFYIDGAGLEFGDIASLASHGANSFRTWRTDNGRDTGKEVLDRAHEHGLLVTMGLEIARERPGEGRGVFGFDYDNEEAVAQQLETVRQEVLQYKDHPALLMWGIGNELNLGATNPKVWDAVNGISKMIHEVDPNHPTTTMLAGIGPELANNIRERASDLDLISIQMYADIVNLPHYLEEIGWNTPYMITEWGATGHWEVDGTEWGAPIENNSSAKADYYRLRYETAIASDTTLCLGSYVFLWGQKQERTPTWYGLFLPSGEKTEPVDVMQHIWTGEWPANRAPRLNSATLAGMVASDNIRLMAGQSYEASVAAEDSDQDSLRYAWEIMHESTDLGHGGDDESVPEALNWLIADSTASTTALNAPEESGAYRLFVYVRDDEGNAAHANLPFHVDS